MKELKLLAKALRCPLHEILQLVGLKPTIPLNAAGTLILPPISEPKANGTHLAPTKPPSPPELPPHDLVLS